MKVSWKISHITPRRIGSPRYLLSTARSISSETVTLSREGLLRDLSRSPSMRPYLASDTRMSTSAECSSSRVRLILSNSLMRSSPTIEATLLSPSRSFIMIHSAGKSASTSSRSSLNSLIASDLKNSYLICGGLLFTCFMAASSNSS